ncbi:hypothetical protein LTR48_006690 [Friedmanniomyces endolithicus]|uniref:Uncharacterized protein n=1 Tax=Rachicladosporium monterosium TaxID=1507873 RepID=A0ABR0KY90_9PEZI|nr:hypothetical protein LTR48_006690 [Friedmanniomyces endolithicus]KAK5140555.1 hypothetical protein LTR32_006675 [Rachicladosporium monterosium]
MTLAIDGFAGSPSDYVAYLESNISALRQREASCTCAASQRTLLPRPTSKRPQELEIIPFHPATANAVCGKRKLRKTTPRWKERALTLVHETPSASTWATKLKERGIFEVMSNGMAVKSLLLLNTNGRSTIPVDQITETSGPLYSNPLARIEHYARISVQREITASVATALANYQIILVLSSCTVLRGTGTSSEEIYRLVRIRMGNDATDERRRKILRGCQFVHELMDSLYMGGWGLRAFELLLVWNKTPTFYCTVSEAYEASLTFLKANLCKDELTTNVETSPVDWTSIFAPKIIHNILGEHIE